MSQQRHIIGRTILEIDSDRLEQMWSFQHDISDLLQQKAIPAMEQLFDQLVEADEVVRLDQVVVQLDSVDRHFLADDFVRKLLDALHCTLSDRLANRLPMGVQAESISGDRTGANAELIRYDRARADWEVLLYFLQYGRLPWWCLTDNWHSWISRWELVMQEGSHWQTPLRQRLMASPLSRQRLVAQFSEGFRHQVVLQLQPTWLHWSTLLAQARQLIQALQFSDRTFQHLQTQAWLLLLSELGQNSSSSRPLPTILWMSAWLTLLLQIVAVEGLPASRLVIRSQDLEGSLQSTTNQEVDVSRQPNAPLGAKIQGDAIAHSRLRSLIESIALADKSLWLTALDQLMSRPFKTFPQSAPPQHSLLDAPEGHQEQTGSAGESNVTTREDGEGVRTLAQLRQSTAPTQTGNTSARTRDSESSLSPEEDAAGVFVNQAGLVILHPYLQLYFEDVGLLEGEVFRDHASQQTAIYLLHYLATRQTDAPEYELVLPKLLCGWPLNEPVTREPALPDTALTEAEHLLQAVIDYWQVLKSTSPDGLREGFLQRDGKLTQLYEGDWKLQVEQKAIDVLLSRLPWGFNVVKLPWMESMLMVEWS